MKKFRNALLSVLLFSFSFLVIHDYMMADLGISTCQAQSLDKVCVSTELAKSTLDGVSHLHDSIHTMIIMESDNTISTALFPYAKPSYIQLGFASNNNFVLERPPLS